MTRSSQVRAMKANLAATSLLLERSPAGDILGRLALESRKRSLEDELASLASEPRNLAEVTLFFSGEPVKGSHAIDATFATKSLSAYQELLTKQLSFNNRGKLSGRGPVPQKDAAKLDIVGLARGSFGFTLMEHDENGPPLFRSDLAGATDQVNSLIVGTAASEDTYSTSIDKVDERVFISLREFIKTLDDSNASLRIVDDVRDTQLTRQQIAIARERLFKTQKTVETVKWTGRLVGVTPFERHFEFQRPGELLISGSFGPLISQEFLERIEGDNAFLGREFNATFEIYTTRGPGARVKVDHVLVSLNDDEQFRLDQRQA